MVVLCIVHIQKKHYISLSSKVLKKVQYKVHTIQGTVQGRVQGGGG